VDLGLTDSVALVTGSSRGLGLAAATALAAEGCRVVLCARGQEALDAAARDLAAAAGADRVHAVTADVALLTYVSEARFDTLERANRSSLWVREGGRWRLRFHQGTPLSST